MLTQNNFAVWGPELNRVGGLGLFLRPLGVDNLILDITTNVAQRWMLKVVPQCVDEFVGELYSGV